MLNKDRVTLRNVVIVLLASTGFALVAGTTCLGRDRTRPDTVVVRETVPSTAGGVAENTSGTTTITSGELERDTSASGIASSSAPPAARPSPQNGPTYTAPPATTTYIVPQSQVTVIVPAPAAAGDTQSTTTPPATTAGSTPTVSTSAPGGVATSAQTPANVATSAQTPATVPVVTGDVGGGDAGAPPPASTSPFSGNVTSNPTGGAGPLSSSTPQYPPFP